MKLDEVLGVTRCAEAALDAGSIIVEQATDGVDLPEPQGYWYDAKQGTKRYHSDASGLYGNFGDLVDELTGWGIDVEALDWRHTTRAVNLDDCTCKKCRAVCLEHHIIPRGLAWHEHVWYASRWLGSALSHWLWWRCWYSPRFALWYWWKYRRVPVSSLERCDDDDE